MKNPKTILALIAFALAPALPLASQEKPPSFALSSNAAYFAFSAFMIGPARATVLIPLEAQIALSDTFALHPSIGTILLADFRGGPQAAMFEAECGLAWRPQGKRLSAWYLCCGPGAAVSTNSDHVLVLGNIEGGYQWILGKGLLLGAGGGGRAIFDLSGGFLPLPDLKLRIGWAF